MPPAPRLAIDAHADTAQRFLDLGEHFTDEASAAEVSWQRARAGGLTAQFFSIWVDPRAFPGEEAWPRSRALVEAVRAEAERDPDRIGLARTAAEVRALADAGKFAALMGLEGCHGLGADGTPVATRLDRLAELARLGVRYAAATWTNSNDFAGSSGDDGAARGLSEAGQQLADACGALGVLVDVSHVSDATFDDLYAWAKAAGRLLVASHSSARALAATPRNLTDVQLRRIAETGGVASVNFCPSFLDEDFRARCRAALDAPAAVAASRAAARGARDPGVASLQGFLARARIARELPGTPDVGRVADHVVHMVDIAGEDHVGLGSDFDGIASVPRGLEDCSRLPALAEALTARGLPPRVLDKVFLGNWLRAIEEV